MMATSPSMRNAATYTGASPKTWMLTYSQYVPAAKVPKLNQKPRQAASRGFAPCQSHIRAAGQMIASGHHCRGAKPQASSAPAASATRRREFIGSGLAAGQPLIVRHEVPGWDHAQRIDSASVGAGYPEFETVDVGSFAAPRQAAELFHQESGDGIEALFLGQIRIEVLVEFVDA